MQHRYVIEVHAEEPMAVGLEERGGVTPGVLDLVRTGYCPVVLESVAILTSPVHGIQTGHLAAVGSLEPLSVVDECVFQVDALRTANVSHRDDEEVLHDV